MTLSVISGLLFVLLAGLNPWIMLTNRGDSERYGRLWIRVHRSVGYIFIAVFAVTVYFMLLRLKGESDEVPPRILLHMSLALILAPLLFIKVLVARYQPPGSRGLLPALGITIFAFSFTLVAVNVLSLLLRNAKDDSVPVLTSAVFIFVVLAAVGTLLLRRRGADGHSVAKDVTAVSAINPVATLEERRIIKLTLSRIEQQTYDSKTLRFVVSAGQRFSARPGQFLTFKLVLDNEELFRSYSICSSPTQTGYVEIVPKRVRNGRVSAFLNERALPGM